jgi:serine protease Do
MRKPLTRVAAVALAAVVLAGTPSRAEIQRRTPIVVAVEKTRQGIVTVKVSKAVRWGTKEVVGSGVIVDERGYLITNHHVVAGADRIAVHLHDGTVLKGTVHTEDAGHDLAILRVAPKKGLKALTFGPGSDLMVGETVIAVGNPFGYTNTVSTGIISALGREVRMPGEVVLSDLIQTNASINQGNSGGPLLNINGEVIGINVAIREGAQGIAFAINADTVQAVLSRHLSARRVASLHHGLVCREQVKPEGKDRQKVIVERVADSSPAARAGLKKGDVILTVADRSIRNRFDVERALWGFKAGDKVETVVLRDGRPTKVVLTLAGPAAAATAAALPRPHR